uniref:Chemokine interleukin-8-like domain-containing protein n=1 Tax=Oryzias latipes TaxID=8090 RepID=A0A3P9LMY4_ORYLA
MTNSKACLAAALCSLLFLSTFLTSCCLRYSRRRPPCKLLLAYSIQTITGSYVQSIHFLCADPSMRWTQKLQLCPSRRQKRSLPLPKEKATFNRQYFILAP